MDERTVDQRIDQACAVLGVEIHPWQREYMRAVMSGEEIIVYRGRRGGWTTVQRLAEHLHPSSPLAGEARTSGASGGHDGNL